MLKGFKESYKIKGIGLYSVLEESSILLGDLCSPKELRQGPNKRSAKDRRHKVSSHTVVCVAYHGCGPRAYLI